jgi:mannose/fructose-specific phosphotransferase system component IIA
VDKLEELIATEKLDTGIIFMTSLKGGTCWNAAVAIARKFSCIEVVSGVNLNMFISFVTKRDKFDLLPLAEIIKADAIRGIDHFKIN